MSRPVIYRCILCSLLPVMLAPPLAWSDTWTDSTGQFSVEAEYVGVEGTKLILRKTDGSEIMVPIDRLSEESRDRAEKLWQMSRNREPAAASNANSPTIAAPEAPASTSLGADTRAGSAPQSAPELNFTPPEPPAFEPMQEFPDDLSLQQTVDFIKQQMMAGHPEVVWFAIPEEIRAKLNSEEFRDALKPAMDRQAAITGPVEDLLMKVVQVLVTKKQFLLNSKMLQQAPPPIVQMIEQGYDPAVGLIYEVLTLQFAANRLGDRSFEEVIVYHLPRIGAHYKSLMPMLPVANIERVFERVQVNQTSETTGTLTFPTPEGETQTVEMVKYSSRWIPKSLADKWEREKDTFITDIAAQVNAADDPTAQQQSEKMALMLVSAADKAITPLLQANTQTEFDQALEQLGQTLKRLSGQPGGPEVESQPFPQ